MKTQTQITTLQQFLDTTDHAIVYSFTVLGGRNYTANYTHFEFDFDPAELEGEVGDNGTWTWDGEGDFTNCDGTTITLVQAYSDEREWKDQVLDYNFTCDAYCVSAEEIDADYIRQGVEDTNCTAQEIIDFLEDYFSGSDAENRLGRIRLIRAKRELVAAL